MVSSRKPTIKKGKKAIDSILISHESACNSLNIPFSLTCCICEPKREQEIDISKKGRIQETNLRKNTNTIAVNRGGQGIALIFLTHLKVNSTLIF